MYEDQSATMLLQLLIQGMVFTLKVTGGLGVKGTKIMGLAVYHALTKENREIGKTSMKQMIARGGEIEILQINEADKKEYQRLAKKYGILYCELPDLNKGDGKVEIMFHKQSLPRMNVLMERLNNAKIISQKDYVNNADKKEVEKLSGEVELNKKTGENEEKKFHEFKNNAFPRIGHSQEKEPEIPRLEQKKWVNYMRYQSFLENPDYQSCIIKKEDVYLEMQDYYFVRVPYSRDNAYMKVSKDRMWLFHDRYHTFLEKNQMVHLYRKDGQEIRSEPFDEFYQDHYDPVAVTILREDYYKTENAAYDGMGKERLPMKKDDIEEARTKKRKGKQKGSEKTKISADKKGQYTDKSTIRFSMDRVLLMEKESTKEEMIFRVPNSSARYYISVSPDELAKTENLTFDDGKKKERITYFMQRREDELLTVHDTKTGKEFQISAKELYNTYYHYDSKWKGKKEPEPARKQKRNTGLSQNKTDASGAGKGKSKPSESKASKPKVKGVKR